MSSQKILKIDPKLFTFNGKKKEKTKKKNQKSVTNQI